MKFGHFRRNFGQGFFAVLTDDVDESLRVLRTVLSPENDCAEVVATTARDTCQQLIRSYSDAVVTIAIKV